MTKKFARITTDMVSGRMSYEIFGIHIPKNSEIEDDFATHLELESFTAHDKVICFMTYQLNSSLVETIAWSDTDTSAINASMAIDSKPLEFEGFRQEPIRNILNARMGIETTMNFMAWYWRNEAQKAHKVTPNPASPATA